MADTTYSIKESTLTAIADAIREKTESNDGIDVSDMASLIAAIESGSGNLWTQTFIPAEDKASYSITHNLGQMPKVVGIFCLDFDVSITGVMYLKDLVVLNPIDDPNHALVVYAYKPATISTTWYSGTTNTYKSLGSFTHSDVRPIIISENYANIKSGYNASTTWYLQAGKTYVFFAGVI